MAEETRTVLCPHCGKQFEGDLMPGSSDSAPSGYKCPHCRLFVPLERAEPGESAA